MWCTRWFLPLILLPLPTAPPIFLLLFLFTLTMHAKPCFYCIILLATLFVSTCYWSPISLDAPLSVPWTENIKTFGEALKSTLPSSYSKHLPSVIQPADRCWCDLSTAGFFEPFNTSQWERLSVEKLRNSLERQQKIEERIKQQFEPHVAENDTQTVIHVPTARVNATSIAKGIWSLLRSRSLPDPLPSLAAELDTRTFLEPVLDIDPPPLPLFRREYDLRLFGVGLVLDFGSSASA
ncbi:hypothetical protein J3R30DRAFT_3439978 [Lentinula aciculospora]|uniref:Uncharacterized protein n=1 Tax=Lentinula aciculospora TaxID=153920 RepID=A0A9W9ALW7_9AGAR|nr:hypothetical protein J3R30DRAFT_3439978 [Lentinula aciculospora]